MSNKIKQEQHIQKATPRMIAQLAYQTAMWYKTAFLQLERISLNQSSNGDELPFDLPWSVHRQIPPFAERFLWVCALEQMLINLRVLNDTLVVKGDNRLSNFANAIINENDFLKRATDLRNAFAHDSEYIIENGHKQEGFVKEVPIETEETKQTVSVTQHWSVMSDAGWFIGGENVIEILNHLRQYRDEVIPLLEKIFTEYLVE